MELIFAFSGVEVSGRGTEFDSESGTVEETYDGELDQRTWSVTPALGVGAQWQFSDHWSLKGEATYYDVDYVINGHSHDTSHTSVMVGVDYHFS
ncbi:outer membrane beta-barrel protein [Vibrio sinaloensis]|nr:outer membrane beta-barrel protein [Vibrio sinaloensis]